MANRKISDLTALTAPVTGDLLPIVDISEAAAADKNKKITYGTFLSSVPLGTAAAPSIAFTGDTNTGIYSPGADQLAISTNGTGRLFINASGNIGVGTSSPANFAGFVTLALADSSGAEIDFIKGSTVQSSLYNASDIFYVESTSTVPIAFVTNGSESARINSSGRLLVGTSSDSGGALFQVNGDRIRVGTAKTPASASATGAAGEICWDASYIYVCTATNTWKRTAIATW